MSRNIRTAPPDIWIKICANTSFADAQLAADAGADAIGFVFGPSPRRVTLSQASAIAPQLPAAIEKIGVFVDVSFAEIAATVEACSLTGVQLHFHAPPDLPAQLRQHFGPSLRILGVVHFTEQTSGEKALALEPCLSDPNIDAILVDSRTAKATGGTGVTYDWIAAGKTFFQNPNIHKPLIVAGGLTPANVAEAIATLYPWGVDVVSGVESAPGKKDPEKVRAFIAHARAAANK